MVQGVSACSSENIDFEFMPEPNIFLSSTDDDEVGPSSPLEEKLELVITAADVNEGSGNKLRTNPFQGSVVDSKATTAPKTTDRVSPARNDVNSGAKTHVDTTFDMPKLRSTPKPTDFGGTVSARPVLNPVNRNETKDTMMNSGNGSTVKKAAGLRTPASRKDGHSEQTETRANSSQMVAPKDGVRPGNSPKSSATQGSAEVHMITEKSYETPQVIGYELDGMTMPDSAKHEPGNESDESDDSISRLLKQKTRAGDKSHHTSGKVAKRNLPTSYNIQDGELLKINSELCAEVQSLSSKLADERIKAEILLHKAAAGRNDVQAELTATKTTVEEYKKQVRQLERASSGAKIELQSIQKSMALTPEISNTLNLRIMSLTDELNSYKKFAAESQTAFRRIAELERENDSLREELYRYKCKSTDLITNPHSTHLATIRRLTDENKVLHKHIQEITNAVDTPQPQRDMKPKSSNRSTNRLHKKGYKTGKHRCPSDSDRNSDRMTNTDYESVDNTFSSVGDPEYEVQYDGHELPVRESEDDSQLLRIAKQSRALPQYPRTEIHADHNRTSHRDSHRELLKRAAAPCGEHIVGGACDFLVNGQLVDASEYKYVWNNGRYVLIRS